MGIYGIFLLNLMKDEMEVLNEKIAWIQRKDTKQISVADPWSDHLYQLTK